MIFLCLIAVVVLYDQLILQEIAIVKRQRFTIQIYLNI